MYEHEVVKRLFVAHLYSVKSIDLSIRECYITAVASLLRNSTKTYHTQDIYREIASYFLFAFEARIFIIRFARPPALSGRRYHIHLERVRATAIITDSDCPSGL